jgi:heptosyltransferase-2
VVGGPGDMAAGAKIAEGAEHRVVDLTGRTSLRQTAAVVGRCRVFLGNDSGPMHLAAAAGVPVVELSAYPFQGPNTHPSSPARFRPWRVPSVVLQPAAPLAPCPLDGCRSVRAHCITQIKTVEAEAAVLRLLCRQRALLRPAACAVGV